MFFTRSKPAQISSANPGYTWAPQSAPGVANWTSSAISSDGKIMAAASADGEVWKSSDGGQTWQSSSSGLPPNTDWNSLTMSSDGLTMYMTDARGAAYSSTGSGSPIWTALSSPPLAPAQSWTSLDSSSNGSVLIGSVNGGPIYISTGEKRRGERKCFVLLEVGELSFNREGVYRRLHSFLCCDLLNISLISFPPFFLSKTHTHT